MEFRIADTFTDSLTRLTAEEQKAVKMTAFDLQLNPEKPGHNFHRLDRARDKAFWSVRVNSDVRLIVHRTSQSLLLCFVGHHDAAYAWAERRKLETHPKTGAAQLVEIRETVQEIFVPRYVETPLTLPPTRPLFHQLSEQALLGYGVPPEWLADVRTVSSEDALLTLVGHLPAEAAEALLELATGGKPQVAQAAPVGADPFEHPDAQRRFRLMTDSAELERALDAPWDKWTVFLHPEQRQLVERSYNGPARVAGSAGTGKTIVALHRAVFVARANPDSRVLLTTFSEALANALRARLRRLVSNQPQLAERLEVHSMEAIGARLHRIHVGRAQLAPRGVVVELIRSAASATPGQRFSMRFLLDEWLQIVDAWQLDSWEAYRDVPRLGRKTRLSEAQRRLLWSLYEQVRTGLKERGLITQAALFTQLAAALAKVKNLPFDYVIVDEAQDLTVSQVKFLAALGGGRPGALFFAGDLGQRIFQQPFSWKAHGIDVRGRSRTLRVCYRTSHQIRAQADRLLGDQVSDVDGNTENRKAVSVFNGPVPEIQILPDADAERAVVAGWLKARVAEGVHPHEIGVFVRSEAQLSRARAAVEAAGLPYRVLDQQVETVSGQASISTMHLAKGLEFKVIVVMACDDEVLPLQERIAAIGDEADLQEVYDTERHLLYVACTRARDMLLVTGIEPASDFLGDLRSTR